MTETIWLLVEISLATGAVVPASPVEYRSERACLAARIGTDAVGVFGALDERAPSPRVIVCRRVNVARMK